MKKVLVIGGGIGGLSCAIRLAAAGLDVRLVEQQATVGGKLQRIQLGAYHFDRGPSTITMLDSFARVFKSADRHIDDYLHFYPLQPLARNLFSDGSQVDLTSDMESMRVQIAAYSAHDASQYPAFMREARALYRISRQHFLQRMMLGMRDKLSPSLMSAFLKIRPLTTLDKLLKKYFRHPNTLAMFGRYATYVGSSPYRAPAIFAMMASLEADEGIYGVYGGTYEIVRAMETLALELGVQFETSTTVLKVEVRAGKAVGAETSRGFVAADLVIANADALTVYSELLAEQHRPSMSDRKIASYEPSLSGFVVLAGVKKVFPSLLHHTVFFPPTYQREFTELFATKEPLNEPTIYVCYSGQTEQELAPHGCSNLFILVNAPSLGTTDWSIVKEDYSARILAMLEARGLTGLQQALEVKGLYTPQDLQQTTAAHRGAIYGISSNSAMQTFFRPGNRSRDIENLWFVGGTTHPGGGTPIVAMSGQLVAERVLKEYRLAPLKR